MRQSVVIPLVATAILLLVVVTEAALLHNANASFAAVLEVDDHGSTRRRPQVVFFFRLGDCPDALQQIDALDSLAAQDAYMVRGIVVEGNDVAEGEVRSVLRSYRVRFPYVVRSPGLVGRALRRLGYDAVPLTVVTDTLGRVVAVSTRPLGMHDFVALHTLF